LYAVLLAKSAIILSSVVGSHTESVNEEIRMTLKNKIQLVAMAALLCVAGTAVAGKQGISFYGGLGLSAVAPKAVNGFEYDPAAGGNITLGIEEDGWFVEYIGVATVKAGTNNPNIEYAAQGGVGFFGYRTLETKGGLYFLLGVGKASFEGTETQTGLPDDIMDYSGNAVSLGMGMRLDKTERIELDYSFMRLSEDDVPDSDFDAHMLTLRYIWGGNSYDPRF
jgi:hypothetical protein